VRSDGRSYSTAWLAAFIAVVTLALATIQSAVMQAADNSPGGAMVMCGSPSPATASPSASKHGAAPDKAHKGCPICAAAAHVPLCAAETPIPVAAEVAWTAYEAPGALGPRGPPSFTPSARGPPPALLTI